MAPSLVRLVLVSSLVVSLVASQMTFTDNWQKRGGALAMDKKTHSLGDANTIFISQPSKGAAPYCSPTSVSSMLRELAFLTDTSARVAAQLSACSEH